MEPNTLASFSPIMSQAHSKCTTNAVGYVNEQSPKLPWVLMWSEFQHRVIFLSNLTFKPKRACARIRNQNEAGKWEEGAWVEASPHEGHGIGDEVTP